MAEPPADNRTRIPLKRLLVAALALVTICCGLFFSYRAALGYAQYFGAYHDDGIYTICAKALAEGKGYRIISLPMEPLQTKYPPGFPGILSIAFRIVPSFPQNIGVIETICSTLGISFILGAGAFLVTSGRATPLLALTVVAASWLNLNFLSFLPVPMADIPCAAASVFALSLCEHASRKRSDRGPAGRGSGVLPWIVIGLALTASVLTHVMGMFAVAAVIIYLCLRRLFAQAAIVLATGGVVLAPAWAWAITHSATAPPTLVYYTNYAKAAQYTASQGALPVFIARNVARGFTELMDIVLQFLKSLPMSSPTDTGTFTIYGAAWLALTLGVGQEIFKRGPRKLIAIWIVIHGLAHLMWPRGVGLRRLLAVLPFVYFYLIRGGRVAGYWVKGLLRLRQVKLALIGTPMKYSTVCALCALLFATVLIAGNLREDLRWAGKYAHRVPPPSMAPPDYTEASEYAEAYDWIKTHTSTSDVLVWNNDPAAYLWTGRKAILASIGESFGISVYPDALITKEDLLDSIKLGHGNYLVIDPISAGGLKSFDQMGLAVEALMKEHPGLLAPVFTSHWGLVTIFKIDQSRLPEYSGPESSSMKSSGSSVISIEKTSCGGPGSSSGAGGTLSRT